MKYMLGYCGVECSKCPAYIATINNDDELRRRYAEIGLRENMGFRMDRVCAERYAPDAAPGAAPETGRTERSSGRPGSP